jgi:hypothetical protein
MAGVLSVNARAAERTGEQIYVEMCAKCHGPMGEGVAGKYDEALHGDRSVEQLGKLIAKTMPEDKPGTCVGEDAQNVAQYIFDSFYSPAARARMSPARIEFQRLTVRQYRSSVADLLGSFRPEPEQRRLPAPSTQPSTQPATQPVEPGGGLHAQYYSTRRFNRTAFERIDPRVEFVFARGTPDAEKIKPEEFSIRWRGSVFAEETGEYEFVLRTENGARLWVNDEETPLIDAWVSSGREPRETRQGIFLLGGRWYPIKLDLFKFKDKTASVALAWKPPHGIKETIPARVLSPKGAKVMTVVATSFPPDDGSAGYERGTMVSKAWDQAATNAAIEVAGKVVEQIDELTGTKATSSDRKEKLRAFCVMFAERAFRGPLSEAEKAFFAEAPFKDAADAETGVKRAVVLVLKSPRFLYPEAGVSGQHLVASRLALALWDSLPDKALLEKANKGELKTAEQVAAEGRRMLADPRAKAKVKDFLHHWLETEEAEDISKDTKVFPDFNEQILADLRTSLDVFLDSVVWGRASDYRELVRADYLFLNEQLATFYGVKRPEGVHPAGFEKVKFDPKERSGVLTHPFLLSALAYHKNTSPIHRGVFITRNIVGRALKPPPAAIEFMDDRFDPSLTMREKVTELTRPAACMGCHSTINPLGFSLEHYDAVGRWRTMDNNKKIDATSVFQTFDGKMIKLTGARDVAEYAAENPEAHRAFIRQLFNYMTKQPVDAYGKGTHEKLRASFVASQYNVQGLLVEIAKVSAMHDVKEVAEKTR